MGSKTKFWYRHSGEEEREWLFKIPREDTGEHWAEKIAAEVAALLDIRHATVELATFDGVRGSVTESFVPDEDELVHGNQMLEWFVHGYEAGRKYGQSSHTLKNIWQVMDGVFFRIRSRDERETLHRRLPCSGRGDWQYRSSSRELGDSV